VKVSKARVEANFRNQYDDIQIQVEEDVRLAPEHAFRRKPKAVTTADTQVTLAETGIEVSSGPATGGPGGGRTNIQVVQTRQKPHWADARQVPGGSPHGAIRGGTSQSGDWRCSGTYADISSSKRKETHHEYPPPLKPLEI